MTDELLGIAKAAQRWLGIYRLRGANCTRFLSARGWHRGDHGKWLSPYGGGPCVTAAAMSSERGIARRLLERALEAAGFPIASNTAYRPLDNAELLQLEKTEDCTGIAADLRDTEPEEYAVLKSSAFNTCTIGDKQMEVGFVVNSPDAGGYCDDRIILIADQIDRPERVIEYSVHECLHCIFPDLPEADVQKYGEQIAAFIVGVFRAKGEGALPSLRPLLTKENASELFPGAVYRGES